jgi:hypothetical protein
MKKNDFQKIIALGILSFFMSNCSSGPSLDSPAGSPANPVASPSPSPSPSPQPSASPSPSTDTATRKTNLTKEQIVPVGEIKVTVPTGWSYQLQSATTLLMTPNKEIQKSPVFIGFHAGSSKLGSVEKLFQAHQDDLPNRSIENWGGLKWDFLEYVKNTNLGYIRNWYAVTRLNNLEYYFFAACPTIADSDYQFALMKIMSSAKLVKSLK